MFLGSIKFFIHVTFYYYFPALYFFQNDSISSKPLYYIIDLLLIPFFMFLMYISKFKFNSSFRHKLTL